MTSARHLASAVLAWMLLDTRPADAQRLLAAVFLFEMDDISLQGAMPELPSHARARLGRLDGQLVVSLERSAQYAPVAVPVDPAWPSLWTCGGCEVEAARRVGAQVAITGWVHKVSDRVFNINLVVRDVANGERVAGGSVNVHDDTDETWRRGLAELLRNPILGGVTAP